MHALFVLHERVLQRRLGTQEEHSIQSLRKLDTTSCGLTQL
jgi:hypothetical protein